MLKKLLALIGLVFLVSPAFAIAREQDQITDWYIKDFQSEIIVNKDSSLDVTEMITADCGNLPGKHGIFRILPTNYTLENGQTVKTPVELKSITDFNGKPYKFSSLKSSDTITWKIGDPDVTVKNVNYYKIIYHVKNTIRFTSEDFDELYWNLNGNFWDIQTDNFQASVVFPSEVNQTNSQIYVYSGGFGIKGTGLASYEWANNNTLIFKSQRMFPVREGITASITFPKNIFTQPPPTFWEKYGQTIQYLFLLIPFIVLIVSLFVWSKFGRDPKVPGTIVPEFDIPENLTPLEMGGLIENGGMDNKYISAAIVNLAVKKVVRIEEISKKHYKLILIDKNATRISDSEKILLDKLFDGKEEVSITDLENKFYEDIPQIKKSVGKKLEQDSLIPANGGCIPAIYWALAMGLFGFIFMIAGTNGMLFLSIILSVIILVIFAIIMPRRTLKGVRLMKKVEGFKLYMKTAERYRQEFNEKENIFEKFLPYAMVFGIVSEWTKSFAKIYQEIHGQDYFATYHPIWFASAVSGQFNPDNFSTNMTSLASSMSTTLSSSPSSSGSGGGGFSGGGGGGGGGGGW